MNPPTQTVLWQEKPYTITWFSQPDEFDFSTLSPITQAYGVCITDHGEAVVLDQGNGSWTLPGGTIEPGETPPQTLVREVMEEADIRIESIVFVGYQRVESAEETYYQTRFVAKITEVLEQTIDPAMNRIHQRLFVPASQISQYVRWGNTGDAMFVEALKKAHTHGIYK